MSNIPLPPAVTIEDVQRWEKMKKELDLLKWQESELRKKIFGAYFPMPSEGTNSKDLGNGYVLKAVYPIERKVDQAQLGALRTLKVKDAHHILKAAGYQDPSVFDPEAFVLDAIHIHMDKLVEYKPELRVREYRGLTAEQNRVVNMFIDSKPGSPQVKVEPTPEKKAELEAAAAPQAQPPITYIPPPPRVG